MEQNLGEIRNLQIINMKRINRLEKMYHDLCQENLDNKYLLSLVRDVQIQENNSSKDFMNLDYFQDVFQQDIQELKDIYLVDDKQDSDDITIPSDFYN